ncbi:MAG: recombinase family protein [Solobacterium sp.]|nr:recombinase family protein [Solobacterium sp.]
MRRRRSAVMGEDTRKVAIYTRKSVITNKGDSIGVQMKQSADYAINQLKLPEDYEFEQYSDKGLSGYYADRPDFQRMLHDIDSGKIRAVACYKLDRISRKTSDLMRLLEYLEKNDVILLVCSNNINTQISTSKIIIQVLAIIAEFERDILTERIQDNLMELSKDGRWMGGQTPTGFDKQRVATGSGKNKSAVSFLVPIPEQREQVQMIFKKFLETRSYNRTCAYMNENGYVTKNGLPFRLRAISDILHNPVYCTADQNSYQFFLDNGANLAGNVEDYDGKHALSGYNKNQQIKDEHEDSTFFNPKFTQLSFRKPINEWIISVGKHEPFISSEDWIAAQELMKAIEEQHNRPHRKTNALLSGLMICPNCGKVLNVVSESGRWTRGRPRFKYVCPAHKKKECDYLAVDGVKLDDQVVRQLADLVDDQKETYFKLIEARIRELARSDSSEREYQDTRKEIEKLKEDIAAQIRNLREADDVLKKFIQEDVTAMSAELSRKEAVLQKLEDERYDNSQIIEDLSQVKKKLADFKESWKTATPEELMSMVRAVVERVYVVYEDDEPIAHIFLKGCIKEDYTSFFDTAGYIPFTGNGVLKVNLCVIQHHENDAEEEIHTQMTQPDKYRELHPYICRYPAQG